METQKTESGVGPTPDQAAELRHEAQREKQRADLLLKAVKPRTQLERAIVLSMEGSSVPIQQLYILASRINSKMEEQKERVMQKREARRKIDEEAAEANARFNQLYGLLQSDPLTTEQSIGGPS